MPVSWAKFYGGYTDAIISSNLVVLDCRPIGDYPTEVPHAQVIGRHLSNIRQHVDGPYRSELLVYTIIKTFLMKKGFQIHGEINGRRRLGMTVYIDETVVLLRTFVPLQDKVFKGNAK